MQKLFSLLIFLHFILNYLILIWSFDFHLTSILIKIDNFTFKGGNKKFIHVSGKTVFSYHKPKYFYFFTKNSLQITVQHLIQCYYLKRKTLLYYRALVFSWNTVKFWNNSYLWKHECDFMSKLIKKEFSWAKKFHVTFRIIDDLCTSNDEGELELKLEHSESHATFLKLGITVNNGYQLICVIDLTAFPFSLHLCQTSIAISHHLFLWKCDVRYPSYWKNILLCCNFFKKEHCADNTNGKTKGK